MKIVTTAQMKEIDRRAIEEFGIPSIVLMENAAIRVADEIAGRFGRGKTFAAVCGPGNNGGDGIAIARHLTMRYGWSGVIWLCEENRGAGTPDRQLNLEMARRIGLPIGSTDKRNFASEAARADLVIDAVLGTGAKGDPRSAAASAIDAMNAVGSGKIVAVDIPSGVDADTGQIGTPCVNAALTVTLALSKIGLHLWPACDHVGELVVGDICAPLQITERDSALNMFVYRAADVSALLPTRRRGRDVNKGRFGSVGLFAGSRGFAGAATLCAIGAVKAGAGLVTLAVPDGLRDVAMSRAPDEAMTHGIADTGESRFAPAGIAQAVGLAGNMDAVGIGPGIGHDGDDVRAFTAGFVAHCPKPLIVDADAINCLALEQDRGVSIVKSRSAATVLTPHPGEMGRLLGCAAADVQADRLGAVRKAAADFGCVVLLKGDRTLICAPDGRIAINETGNPGMSSGGMGDILTGIATTFLAQIPDPFQAAATAAFIHGLAGDLAAEEIPQTGLCASDVGMRVPAAVQRCREE